MADGFGFRPNSSDEPEDSNTSGSASGNSSDEASKNNAEGSQPDQPPFPFDINQVFETLKNMGIQTPDLPEQVKDQLNSLTAMAQGMLAGGEAPFNLPVTAIRDISRRTLASHGELPVGNFDNDSMAGALEVAEIWVDEVTSLPRAGSDSSVRKAARSRSEWINYSIDGWQSFTTPLVEGIAKSMSTVMDSITNNPEIVTELGGAGKLFDPSKMMAAFMGTMIRTQLGRSIGNFAATVTSAHDAAVPLSDEHTPFLIPENVRAWGDGLGIDQREVEIFLALRESAASRLFAATPWLSQYMRSLVGNYGSGITIDIDSMQRRTEDALSKGEIDLNDPASMQNAIAEGIFTPEASEKQKDALARLEMILALIEGWIDLLVVAAAGNRLASLSKLQETQQRRRATQSPTQQLFASLIGLEVSPRTIRECVAFWRQISEKVTAEDRDRLWEEAYALPIPAEISDPEGFLKGRSAPDDLSSL